MGPFNPQKFFRDVFGLRPTDIVAILTDLPTDDSPDNPAWNDRRWLASEWELHLDGLKSEVGFNTLPIFQYPATGSHGAELPARILTRCGRNMVSSSSQELAEQATLILAMTEFSATAPLLNLAKARGRDEHGDWKLRVASMPHIERRMQETALSADYAVVARRARQLQKLLTEARSARVTFSSGHVCFFDLRFNHPEADDGYLHADKEGDIPLINLPSGEAFQVPYEGGLKQESSRTDGKLPVMKDGELVVFRVGANRIVDVQGTGPNAQQYRELFEEDPARRNIAEFAFGCNDKAVVTGNVLEDEKAGFHWAYGRSDHLGGTWGPNRFKGAAIHQDTVYAKGCPIEVTEATLFDFRGMADTVIKNGKYDRELVP